VASNLPDPAAPLRTADPDRYLSALYTPEKVRGDILALYAFNAEIAAIRDRIREPMAGEIRLQWWRDAIAAGDAATGHPLADALLAALDRHALPRDTFDNMLQARIFDLYDDPMPSRTDLEGYCGETASALIQLAAMILDASAARQVTDLSGHAGCAQAITGLIRLIPIHRARGQCYVPAEILAACGTDRDGFLSAGPDDSSARAAVEAMAALASQHHAAFAQGAATLPTSLRPAFLPLAPVQAYLSRIAHRPGEALEQPAQISALRRNWLILRRAMKGWH
jgi:15-cis-phytoene synthase